MELRCRKSNALAPTTHIHKQARGSMYVPGEGWRGVAQHTGTYTAEESTVFAKAVKTYCDNHERPKQRVHTRLWALAQSSKMNTSDNGPAYKSHGTQIFDLRPDDFCVDLGGHAHRQSPILLESDLSLQADVPEDAAAAAAQGDAMLQHHVLSTVGLQAPKAVNQYHKVSPGPTDPAVADTRSKESAEAEKEQKRLDDAHETAFLKATAYWKARADAKDWHCISSDLSVYQYCGQYDEILKSGDPRRNDAYRKKVIEGLGFGEGKKKDDLTEADMVLMREVLSRKAAAFWLEGEPRTALRYLQHDTIPTGPPCRTPPHRLKGEEADFVDAELQKDVQQGQLIRGNSEWASPPFATKAFAEHRRQRKRRIVVDYRRVNQRILRAVYFVRSADGVVFEVAGSMWCSFVDACKGFNQVANTRRAREMLAILARSGQYLPVCLTFGPTNGPEDFAFATDRVFAPGRGRKMRFCKNWQIYADDITVRTGRWRDNTYFTDEQSTERIRTAQSKSQENQPLLDEAFKALGFNPEPLGKEKQGKLPKAKAKPRRKTEKEKDQEGLTPAGPADRSPYAHIMSHTVARLVFLVSCAACIQSPVAVSYDAALCSLLDFGSTAVSTGCKNNKNLHVQMPTPRNNQSSSSGHWQRPREEQSAKRPRVWLEA
ncbi:MAG: hypothetical protein CMA68_03335, partial [Euryarchaeota archaeon]|nr:hypothetical protein [Euryarchaeota archaeon]